MAEKSSPGTRQTDSKNLVWFGNRKKISQIFNAYLYFPVFLLIILCMVMMVSRQVVTSVAGPNESPIVVPDLRNLKDIINREKNYKSNRGLWYR
jgi:hypothetical protein